MPEERRTDSSKLREFTDTTSNSNFQIETFETVMGISRSATELPSLGRNAGRHDHEVVTSGGTSSATSRPLRVPKLRFMSSKRSDISRQLERSISKISLVTR